MNKKLLKNLPAQMLFAILLTQFGLGQNAPYFPAADFWETRQPAQAGINGARLNEAIGFAVANESAAPRDQELSQLQTFGREPFGGIIGPTSTRGAMSGVIVKNGFIIAKWGEPFRVDMTHSVTKSFIAAVVGLAFDRGLINDLDAPVYREIAPVSPFDPMEKYGDADRLGKPKFLELFESEHNRKISWDDLLRQTSNWDGTLFGKPDWADRPDRDPRTWLTAPRSEPGTVYEYNDTRVNLLALCALNVWRKPLPQVLRENIMDEIGASRTWRWHGYENSYVLLDGQIMQSVSGGGHWGGGMFISARDMARFGLLIGRGGKWRDKQLLSAEFLARAETPTVPEPTYGYMNFFLNTDKKLYPSAPEGTIAFLGNGTNIIYIDRKQDLVIVARWIENGKIDEFLGKIYASFE